MAMRVKLPTHMRTALACILAVIIAFSMGHSHVGLAFSTDHHIISVSNHDDRSGHHNHQFGGACTACPATACSFLVAAADGCEAAPGSRTVVFKIEHQRLHPAFADGPLRPPNAESARA